MQDSTSYISTKHNNKVSFQDWFFANKKESLGLSLIF